jgi:hypothetical protein
MVMGKKVVENAEIGAAENAAPESVENEEQKIEEMMSFKLNQSFKYDGEEITELDLSGLLDLNAHDLVDIDREMTRRGFAGARNELTRQYAMLVAARCNKKPWDFCDRMSARDSIRLKEYVVTFFYATV